MTNHDEREQMTAEQARANHPSRTGSPAASQENLDRGDDLHVQVIEFDPDGLPEELAEILGALMGNGHDHGHGRTTAEHARRMAPPGTDFSFEAMADLALGADHGPADEPEVIESLTVIHRDLSATFEQARTAARRLVVGRDKPPARIITDIAIMIEQGTGADPEVWAPLAAYGMYYLIKAEQDMPGDGETPGRQADRRRLPDAVAAYGAAMVAGETGRAARLWGEIADGLSR